MIAEEIVKKNIFVDETYDHLLSLPGKSKILETIDPCQVSYGKYDR
jgi:hypothetical protein